MSQALLRGPEAVIETGLAYFEHLGHLFIINPAMIIIIQLTSNGRVPH